MMKNERYFLNGLIRALKPKKILEVGVANGGGTATVLHDIIYYAFVPGHFSKACRYLFGHYEGLPANIGAFKVSDDYKADFYPLVKGK